jgi:hypothetical protein
MELRVLGTPLQVIAPPEVTELLAELLNPFLTSSDAAPTMTFELAKTAGEYRLIRDVGPVATRPSLNELIDLFLAELNGAAIDAYDQLAIHAGVVRLRDRTIAFPAESGRGKTTLTAACLDRGFTYISDEALCIRLDDLSVDPYPRPLALSNWSRVALGLDPNLGGNSLPLTAAALGASVESAGPPLTDVVLPTFGDSGDAPRLVATSRSDVMARLLELSFNHYKFGREAFRVASELARRTRAWQLSYGEPRRAAELLAERLVG